MLCSTERSLVSICARISINLRLKFLLSIIRIFSLKVHSIFKQLPSLGSIPRCGDTGVKLAGIKAARPHELKHATKRTKTVSRTYGGTLSAQAVRQRILRSFLSAEQTVASKLLKANEAKK